MSERVPVAILCGGRGTRMGSTRVPKPLIEIGGKPIVWHIMKLYESQGFDEFVLLLGYGGEQIRDAIGKGSPGNVTFLDTGVDTNTGGRIKKLQAHVEGTFMATYGDGLARIDLGKLLDHHTNSGRTATVTCVRTEIPFGLVRIGSDSEVVGFAEKPKLEEWINGGFFVFEPKIFDYLDDNSVLEEDPLKRLASEGQLTAYRHEDFWACMDTYKEALHLNELWENGAPWKMWSKDHAEA